MRGHAPFRLWTSLLAIVGGLVCYAVPLAAQQTAGTTRVMEGVVLDASGAAIAGLDVVLHRVTAGGGVVVAESRTGDDGGFLMQLADSAGSGVYFVAVRYEGQLHIGPMIRPPFPAGSEYVVRVGVDPTESASGTRVQASRQEDSSVGPALVLGLLGGCVAAAIALAARRPTARRRLLIRLAREEERAAAGGPAPRVRSE
ncbi:MAG: hypothetical protein ACRELX_09370 [Longimicrobiales bacterium]